jgi:RNA recognition motif-containing protein
MSAGNALFGSSEVEAVVRARHLTATSLRIALAETTVEEITTYYQKYGEVLEAYIPMDRNSGKGRGFAFVTMKEEDAARALDETNGTEYEGRRLVVSVPLRK